MSEAFAKAITSIPVLGSIMQGRVSPRRAFLAGSVASTASAALTVSVAGMAGASSVSFDAELIALCAKFHRLHSEGADEANPAWEKANADAWDTFNQLDDMTPATEAGHRAKAGVAVRMLVMFHGGVHGGDPEAMFALNTLQGWLGSVGA